jgi:hypothetical protein
MLFWRNACHHGDANHSDANHSDANHGDAVDYTKPESGLR